MAEQEIDDFTDTACTIANLVEEIATKAGYKASRSAGLNDRIQWNILFESLTADPAIQLRKTKRFVCSTKDPTVIEIWFDFDKYAKIDLRDPESTGHLRKYFDQTSHEYI